MTERSDEEIVEFFKQLYAGSAVDVDIDRRRSGRFEVSLEGGYGSELGLTFANILQIAAFFGTDKINFRPSGYVEGYESCGYSSVSYLVVEVRT